ncbi:MAG: (d)CMP kinase [Candidatus Cloacimonetes bacterium]|nr:(d)CMP kinase [Candidatus Cloacimonadota bacterium]
MRDKFVIAIDGPAASGKSTTARVLAKEMQYVYIDTGAMYRACALQALQKNIELKNIDALEQMLRDICIRIEYSPDGNRIYIDGKDVSERIREADITRLASEIAVIEIVRLRMVELQREMGKNGGVIMDGRDIGTVVFPDAEFKFFMIADVKTRAKRRWLEAQAKGEILDLKEVEKELLWRDENDSHRSHSPLKRADDAIDIDTTGLTIEEQTALIRNIIKARYTDV